MTSPWADLLWCWILSWQKVGSLPNILRHSGKSYYQLPLNSHRSSTYFPLMCRIKSWLILYYSGQNLIFHQPRFLWNKGKIPLLFTTIWGPKTRVFGRELIWPGFLGLIEGKWWGHDPFWKHINTFVPQNNINTRPCQQYVHARKLSRNFLGGFKVQTEKNP